MWISLLAQPDSLTLPGYGLAGIVIAGLSTAVLKLYNANTRLSEAAIARERETANTTIPLLVKAVELLSATPKHLDRAYAHDTDEIASALHRVESLVLDLERREKRRGPQ